MYVHEMGSRANVLALTRNPPLDGRETAIAGCVDVNALDLLLACMSADALIPILRMQLPLI